MATFSPSLVGGIGKLSKILLYAVVALELIELAKERHEQIVNGDFKPVNVSEGNGEDQSL
ncbi:hypothetical protein [Taibaiella koreensis]|uniref:hypothetical protein n=1 Tax=Taibaiella koreensis TaxID=1268548 RepID=UPI000E59CD84|nr:hypothetical protein [Taibaiella koreensis]